MPQILDFKQLCALLHLSRSRINQLLAKGEFPKPLKLSAGRSGRVIWRLEDVEAWLAQKAAKSQA